MIMDVLTEEILISGAAELGVNLEQNEVILFAQYMDLLLEWNQKMNLTAIRTPGEIVVKHFLDSIAVLPHLTSGENTKVLDIGTGAGFPGVPMKIIKPNMVMVLLDSLGKRITFLDALIMELGLTGITTLLGRAEDLARTQGYRESFDVVTSRAVAKLSVLSELCLPFLKIGGLFVAYKGPKTGEELPEAQKALAILGGRLAKVVEINLPGTIEKRNLVFIEKHRSTPEKYPRKAGTPEKKPL